MPGCAAAADARPRRRCRLVAAATPSTWRTTCFRPAFHRPRRDPEASGPAGCKLAPSLGRSPCASVHPDSAICSPQARLPPVTPRPGCFGLCLLRAGVSPPPFKLRLAAPQFGKLPQHLRAGRLVSRLPAAAAGPRPLDALAPTALAVASTIQAAVLPPNAPGCAALRSPLTRRWRIRVLAFRASTLRVPTLGISPRPPDSDSASLWHPIAAALLASDVTVASLRSPPALPATAGRRGGSRRRPPMRIPLFASHSPHARGRARGWPSLGPRSGAVTL